MILDDQRISKGQNNRRVRSLKAANNCHNNKMSVVGSGVRIISNDNELNRKKPAHLISLSNELPRANYRLCFSQTITNQVTL